MLKRYRPTSGVAKGISRRAALAVLTGIPCLALDLETDEQRLPRDQLLWYRRSPGSKTLRRATKASQWRFRRAEILRGFEAVAGPLPSPSRRCALDVTVEEEVDEGDF